MNENTDPARGFDDLLAANQSYADAFTDGGFDGIARAGVLMLTCMDSRIDPLRMLGLHAGDAKILRNAGARLTDTALEGVVLGVNLLEVTRILIVPHTRCAVGSSTEAEIEERVAAASGQPVDHCRFHVVTDQVAAVRADVHTLRDHPLIPAATSIGGFLYDVDTGLLSQVV